MDNDDETPSPDNFLLSHDKENIPQNMNETLKSTSSYQCHLCRKHLENSTLTCSECVNKGQFYSSKHDTRLNNRREFLLNMLNKDDYEEFQQYSSNTSIHLQ